VQIWSWSGFFDYLLNPFLLEGAVTTLWLTVASLSAGLVLGIGLALMRQVWLLLANKNHFLR
jgi:polar amino acid transport system permease protein